MEIRDATASDVALIAEIDAVVESTHYLHVTQSGEGLELGWNLQERPLRAKLMQTFPASEDATFLLRQIVNHLDEGLAIVAEHEGAIVGMALAQQDYAANTLRLFDLRVDYDLRRQGLGMAMAYRVLEYARQAEVRAVAAQTLTNNIPAARFLEKLGFVMAGLDVQRASNHDLVKDAVTLFWYATVG